MAERRRHEPAPLDHADAALPPTSPARRPLQVAESVGDRRLVRANNLSHDLRLTDREQHTHALRRPERQIEPGHRTRAKGPAKQLARSRISAAQQPHDAFLAYLTR